MIEKIEEQPESQKETWSQFLNVVESLKKREAEIKLLVENSPDILWTVGRDFGIIYVNPAHEKIRGYKYEEAIGTSVWDAFFEEDIFGAKKTLIDIAEGRLKSGDPVRFEARLKRKDGSFIWSEAVFNQVIDDKQLIRFAGAATDITERKVEEEKALQLNFEQADLYDKKDRFISRIMHDLRSPYQGLLGVLFILTTEFESLGLDEVHRYITLMNESLLNQNRLLENIANWFRIQNNRMNYEPEILNLSFELNKALQPLDDIFGNKEIRLEINVDEVHLAYCDPIMLGLLLTNLLTNAVKFSHRGGKVEINSTNEGTGTVVEVKDSGVGIGKAEIEKLFRIEIQYSTEGTEGERGSGLGLILGRKIIDKNRGKIWVESELGKGSSFKFMLPDKPAEYKT